MELEVLYIFLFDYNIDLGKVVCEIKKNVNGKNCKLGVVEIFLFE